MAATGLGLVTNGNLKRSAKSPGFANILTQQREESSQDEGDHFVRFRPDGSLAVLKHKIEAPPVDEEEIKQRRLEKIEREVYQRAFAEGEKTGLEVGQERMEQEIHRLIPQLESVIRELDNLPHRVFTASEQFIVESLISFNRELLGHELSINPEGIAERVNRIMSRSTGRKNIIIRVSPGNADILNRMEGFEKIEIQADSTVMPGSVVMESDFGGMEDSLEERLREMETALRQQLQERLDQSGVADISETARQKMQQEANAELTPLAADPEIQEPEEDLGEEDGFPLESISDDLLDLDEDRFPAEIAPEKPLLDSQEADPFPLEAVSDESLDDFLGESQSMDEPIQPATSESTEKSDSGEWSALSEEDSTTVSSAELNDLLSSFESDQDT